MTLSFVFAVIGVALVAYCFVKLSQHISHTGSVYALVGVTLGPRAGFFAGWALMGAYIAIGCGSTIEIGLFGGQFLQRHLRHPHRSQWWWIALIGLAGVARAGLHRDPHHHPRAAHLRGDRRDPGHDPQHRDPGQGDLQPRSQAARRSRSTSWRCPRAAGSARSPRRRCTGSWPSPASRARPRSARRPSSPKTRDPARDQDRGRRRRRLLPADRGRPVARLRGQRRRRQGVRRRPAVHRPRRRLHRQVVRRHPQPDGHDQPVRDLARGGQRRGADHVRPGPRRHRQADRPRRPVQATAPRRRAGRRAGHLRASP